MVAGVVCATGAKAEPAVTAPAVPAVVAPAAVSAQAPAGVTKPMEPAITAVKTAGATVAPALSIPDFQTASVAQLSGVALQALTSLGQTAGLSPAVSDKVKATKTALAGNQASSALSSLSGLGAMVKGIPGAEGLAGTATQLVSAWALKQGFDTAKISGVLGALQKQDYAALASQGASVLSKGGLTGDQKGLMNAVLGAYGIDAGKAAGAVGALKGMFGR